MLNQTTYVIYHISIFPAAMAFFIITSPYFKICVPDRQSTFSHIVHRLLVWLGTFVLIVLAVCYSVYKFRTGVPAPYQLPDSAKAFSTLEQLVDTRDNIREHHPDFDETKIDATLLKNYQTLLVDYKNQLSASTGKTAQQNMMSFWNHFYTGLLLSCAAFVLVRFLRIMIYFFVYSDPCLSRRCFTRVCIRSFVPLLVLCMFWLPLRVYADWSETFFLVLGTPQNQPYPTVIFVILATFIISVLLYMFIEELDWKDVMIGSPINLIKPIAVTLIAGVVMPNAWRDGIFMAIYFSLRHPEFQVGYAVVTALIAIFFGLYCRNLIKKWILSMPMACVLSHCGDDQSLNFLKTYFGVGHACEVSVGMVLDLGYTGITRVNGIAVTRRNEIQACLGRWGLSLPPP